MDATFSQLSEQYDAFLKIATQITEESKLIKAQNLLGQIIKSGRYISELEERRRLSVFARNLGEIIFNFSKEFPLVRLDKFVDESQVNFFVNRESEIGSILSSLSPVYYLINAPRGYGKTALLRELEQRFKKEGWSVAYISISKDKTLTDLAVLLADKFSLNGDFDQELRLPVEYRLAGALTKHWFDSTTPRKQGLVLLIDFAPEASSALLEELLKKLLPAIQKSLHTLPFFAQKQNRFRTIIAVHDLAVHLKVAPGPTAQYNVLRLAPFDYQNSQELTRRYLADHEENVMRQLAPHLFHLTGGHLGCILQILEFYKNQAIAPELFIEFFLDTLWQDMVRQIVLDIRDQIAQPIQEILGELELLSIFRSIDETVLESIIKDVPLFADKNAFDLADDLTTIGLFEREGRFLQNHITRPLLTILLRNEKPNEFAKACQRAQEICAKRLQQPYVQSPEIWVIEYLFHALQKHANAITDSESRRSIRKTFLHQEIPNALLLFINEQSIQAHHRRAEQNALHQAIEEDDEFRFMVNYYLRDSQYHDEPYQKLKEQIQNFFMTL